MTRRGPGTEVVWTCRVIAGSERRPAREALPVCEELWQDEDDGGGVDEVVQAPELAPPGDIGAIIACLRASVINGWLGNAPLNPALDERNHAIRQAHRNRKIKYVNFRTMERRLRIGRVSGGRYPPRPRARPPSARRNSATS